MSLAPAGVKRRMLISATFTSEEMHRRCGATSTDRALVERTLMGVEIATGARADQQANVVFVTLFPGRFVAKCRLKRWSVT